MAAKIKTIEVLLLLVKARIDTSPAEICKPTFIFQSEEQTAKTMPVDLVSHLLLQAENYFIYVNIVSCLILTEQENQFKHISFLFF